MSLVKSLVILCLLLLNGCSTLVPVPTASLSNLNSTAPLAAYARVLQRYVNQRGEVDFNALQKQRTDLEAYIALIAKLPASSIQDSDARLAHYLNSYNALSMYNVLELGIPKTNAGFAKVEFFFWRKFLIGGERLSLYSYENEVIRALKEPRVHFALNCSALSCPVLPMLPFSGADLNQTLEHEAFKFFSEQRNLRIDHRDKKVYLSEILDFFTDDFISPATPTLIDYVNRYAPEKIPTDYAVEFNPYDWTIANTAP